MGYIRIRRSRWNCRFTTGRKKRCFRVVSDISGGTSLPIGGESTHAVLTGHRGLPSKMLFTDLDELEQGDIFLYLYIGRNAGLSGRPDPHGIAGGYRCTEYHNGKGLCDTCDLYAICGEHSQVISAGNPYPL